MKKTVEILTVTLIVFLFISGCVSRNSQDNDIPSDLPVEEVEQPEIVKDLKGYEFIIKTEVTNDLSLAPTAGQSDRGDNILKRYTDISKAYNCIVASSSAVKGASVNDIKISKATLGKYADLLEISAYDISNLYTASMLTALESFETLDLTSEKWGYKNQRSIVSFNDKSYGFKQLYWGVPVPTVSNMMFYNSARLEEVITANPHELFETNGWTWENFEDICASVTQTVGDDQSYYAFATPDEKYSDFIHAAIYSNGGKWIKKTDSGKNYSALTDIEVVDALSWVYELVNNQKVSYDMIEDPNSSILDVLAFTNLRTAFLVTNSWAGIDINEAFPLATFSEEFRWISFPKGPKFPDDGSVTAVYTSEDQFSSMTYAASAEECSIILDAMFEPLNQEDEEGWKKYLKRNYFFHEPDFNIFLNALEKAVSDDTIITKEINGNIDAAFSSVLESYKTPREALLEIESVVNSTLK